jgi:hypothetical protein
MATEGRKTSTKRARAGKAQPKLGTWFHRANLLTSTILVFPLLLAYQLAVLARPEVANGADLLTVRLYKLLGSRENYVLFNLGMLLAFVLLLAILRRKQRFDVRLFIPVVLESGIYALTMGAVIVFVMGMIGINPTLWIAGHLPAAVQLPGNPGPLARIALAAGAGVHEEIVFRLLLLPALVWTFEKVLGANRALAWVAAFVVSSLVFSAAHHVIGGEPWRLGAFTYRFFCGMIFATLFQFRGFAVAVYTHTLYDVYVMLIG